MIEDLNLDLKDNSFYDNKLKTPFRNFWYTTEIEGFYNDSNLHHYL